MVKKKNSSYLMTIFSRHNLCPLCCILLPIPFQEKTTRSVDKGRAVNIIHTDFSKEFDIVTHCILGPKDIIVWMSGQLDGSETNRMVRLS